MNQVMQGYVWGFLEGKIFNVQYDFKQPSLKLWTKTSRPGKCVLNKSLNHEK
jgi:hypothetical protein